MRCKHKFNKVQKDGYQYCDKCGKAEIAPCKHKWVERESIDIVYWGALTGKLIVFECTKCRAIRQERVSTWEQE